MPGRDQEILNLKAQEIAPDAIQRIPASFASFYKVIPVSWDGEELVLAAANPFDPVMLDALPLVFEGRVRTKLAREEEVLAAISKFYGVGAQIIEQIKTSQPQQSSRPILENIEDISSEASVAKFLNQLLLAGYRERASDIHLESQEKRLRIRYRVDGELKDFPLPSNISHFKDAIISRIKVMANLNIAQRRLPQDGRFRVKIGTQDLDLRVSILPAVEGESVVIRILSSIQLYQLNELGLEARDQGKLDLLLKKTHGIIFVTGPTGSGKTTTLYACLSRLNDSRKKIITIEDPVEVEVKGVTQIQVNPGIRLTFAAGLRSMLRHDPDIMMVGEVRDPETAQIAIQIALTGHLVLSTLHTNDACSGITRLLDMGIEPYLVASAVECFIAQRLVRLICLRCRKKVVISAAMLREMKIAVEESHDLELWEGAGCEECHGTGFRGRIAIYEILYLTDELRDLILSKASASQIKACAMSQGMKTLGQDGWEKVRMGRTTLAELLRINQENDSAELTICPG